MNTGISINENALGRESLRAMARHGVSVIEVAMSQGVKLDLTAIVEARRDMAIGSDRIDHCKVAVGDAERFVGRCELNLVADGEFMRHFAVDIDAG